MEEGARLRRFKRTSITFRPGSVSIRWKNLIILLIIKFLKYDLTSYRSRLGDDHWREFFGGSGANGGI